MKLGAFWGMTAPMLLLAYDNVEDIVHTIRFTRDATAGDAIEHLHTELHYLKQASKFMTCELTQPEGGWFSDNEHSAQIAQGTVVGSSCPIDMALIDVRNELTIRVAQKIIDGERKGTFVSTNVKSRSDLEDLANSTIANSTFAASAIPRVAGKLYRELKDASGTAISAQLLSEFQSTTKLLDSFLPGLEDVEQRQCIAKIFDFYMDRMNDIDILLHETIAKTKADAKVFDMELSDLLRRKPNFLNFVTIRWFKYLSASNTGSGSNQGPVLLSAVEDFSNNLTKFVEMLDSSVVSTESRYTEKRAFDTRNFAVSSIIKNVDDFDENDLIALDEIYTRVMHLSISEMAEKFGVDEEVLSVCMRKACDVGICGLNSRTAVLFTESVNNVILSDPFVCSKSHEYLQELQIAIDNATAVVNNIKPIGAELESA